MQICTTMAGAEDPTATVGGIWHICRHWPRAMVDASRTSFMDSQTRHCQDLNNQLAVYRAFNNRTATAAVLRQMASVHCPIEPSRR